MKYFIIVALLLVLPLVGCGEEYSVVAPDGVAPKEVEPPIEIKSEGAITAIPATYELSDKGSVGFEPGKYTIDNFGFGKEADLPVTLHNGRNSSISFLLSYVTPSYTEEGYEVAPEEAMGWLSFAPAIPELQPQEKKDFVATLHLPEDVGVPNQWEFWIEIKEAGQTSEVQTAGCLRVFVNMR